MIQDLSALPLLYLQLLEKAYIFRSMASLLSKFSYELTETCSFQPAPYMTMFNIVLNGMGMIWVSLRHSHLLVRQIECKHAAVYEGQKCVRVLGSQ